MLENSEATKSLSIKSSDWIIKFESKARKNLKTQYTSVFEELRFLQQCSYRTLWTGTKYSQDVVFLR